MSTPKFVQEDLRLVSPGAPVDFEGSTLASLTARPRAPTGFQVIDRTGEDPTRLGESANRVFEDYEQIYMEVGMPTSHPPEPPEHGGSGEGGPPHNNQENPDVELSPVGRLLAGYLKWAFILIVVFLACAALGIMVISFLDYGISMRSLSPGIDLSAYEAYLETVKDISDLAIERLSNISTLFLGILIGLFIRIVEKFPRR